MSNQVELEESWKTLLLPEFSKPYFEELKAFLVEQKQSGKQIYPPGAAIFAAFNLTPLPKAKVVIIGQDPYHGIGQAHGLCFSVNKGVAIPPSLQNIYKEIAADFNKPYQPQHGDLSHWAKQGVLLLNATLTVEKDKAGSHQGKGWEQFTDKVISEISTHKSAVVFLLWGKFAQSKATLINTQKHLVLMAAHPSPFSAYNGFFGCKHFSQTNQFLNQHGLAEINW